MRQALQGYGDVGGRNLNRPAKPGMLLAGDQGSSRAAERLIGQVTHIGVVRNQPGPELDGLGRGMHVVRSGLGVLQDGRLIGRNIPGKGTTVASANPDGLVLLLVRGAWPKGET